MINSELVKLARKSAEQQKEASRILSPYKELQNDIGQAAIQGNTPNFDNESVLGTVGRYARAAIPIPRDKSLDSFGAQIVNPAVEYIRRLRHIMPAQPPVPVQKKEAGRVLSPYHELNKDMIHQHEKGKDPDFSHESALGTVGRYARAAIPFPRKGDRSVGAIAANVLNPVVEFDRRLNHVEPHKGHEHHEHKASSLAINPELVSLARYAVHKRAFVPSDAVAGQGGPQGGGQGAPPPGGPQGPPPGMPPGGGGSPPPGAGGPPPSGGANGAPDLMTMLPQLVQQSVAQAMQQQQMQGGGGAGNKQVKADINTIAMDLFQLKKLLLHDYRSQGKALPPDVMDGPNRDPSTGMPTSPEQGSILNAQGQPAPQGPQPQSSIKPMQPMQGAFPMPQGGGKSAAAWDKAQEHLDVMTEHINAASSALLKYADATGLKLDYEFKEVVDATPVFDFEVGQEVKSNHQAVLSKAAALAKMCARRNAS